MRTKTNTRYLGHVFGYIKKPYCSRGFRILPKVNLKLWWIPQSSLVSKFETFSLFCDNDMRQKKGQKKVRVQTLANKTCIFTYIYNILDKYLHVYIYIYLYTPYTLEVQLTNQSVWCLRWSHGFPQRFSPPIKGGGVWTPCNSGLVNLNPWMGWQNKKSQWFLRYVFSLPTPGHAC